MRLIKVYSRQENSQAQAEDEKYCEYPEGVSWVNKMSAAWEVAEVPGLVVSAEPPPNQFHPQRMSWQVWTQGGKEESSWVAGQLRGQRFATRREALQAIQVALENRT